MYIMVAGLLAMVGHREREAGFRAVLAEHHLASRFVGVLESREDIDGAGHLVRDAVRRNPAIRGLYHASAGARPVVEALRAIGGASRVVFITHELTEDRRVLLRDRAIDAVIDQDPEAEVRVAVETMARLLGRLDGGARQHGDPDPYLHARERSAVIGERRPSGSSARGMTARRRGHGRQRAWSGRTRAS